MTTEQIREFLTDHAGCCPALRTALEAAQAECERLRKAIHPVPLNQAVFDASVEWAKRAKATEAELSALKAKMEKVRQVLDETKRLRTDAFDPYVSSGKLLAILDGKEG